MSFWSPVSATARDRAECRPVSRRIRARTAYKFMQTVRGVFAAAKPTFTFVPCALTGVLIAAFVLAMSATSDSRPLKRGTAKAGASVGVGGAASMLSSYRHSNGLSAVSVDSTLTRLAQQQARAMAASDQLSHDVGGDFSTRLRSAGYRSRSAAENISAGYHNLRDAFGSWVGSSGHRANLLLQGATRMGIAAAVAPNSRYGMYWALIVAEPAGGGGHAVRRTTHRSASR